MTIYTKTMKEALESMYISEDNVAILRDIVKRKSIMTLKFADGKMKVDLFTASAVTQALDKVNPANKAKITKMINMGKKANFMSIAKVVMKSENNPEIEEEVEVEVKVEEASSLAQQAAILISKRERERNPRKEEGLVTIVEGLSMIIKDPKTKKKIQLAANQKVQWNGSNYETDGVTKKQVLVMKDGSKEVVMTKQQIEDDLKNGSFKVTDLGNVYQPEELQDVDLDEAVKVGDNVKVKLIRKGREYIEKGKVTKIEKDSIIVKHDFSRTPSKVKMTDIVKEEVKPDEMDPKKHVGKSKKNPDMFCVFDTKGNEVKLFKDKKDAEEFAAKNHDMLMGRESKKEEVKLDELMPPSRHVGKSEKNPDMFAVYDQKGKEVKLFKDEGDAKEYATKNHEALMGHDKPKKEESDLDEAMLIGRDYEYDEKEGVVKISKKNFTKVKKDYKGTDKSKPTMMVLTKKGTSLVPVKFTEEVELDEALKTTHVIVDTAQGNMVISSAAGGNAEKNLQSSIASAERPPLSIKDKKTLKIVKLKKPVSQKKADDLMGQPLKEEVEESYEYGTDEYAKHTRDVTPGQGKEIDEARPSARRDAMKAMGKRKSDSADDDDYVATADDRKAADKNIIMQLRKATNLGGKYEVEFKDKKKIKVKPAIAMAFIKKYEKMKPVDKAKLQDKGSKSYKDLLKGLKEEDTSMLGRIEKKLKEIRNG